MLLLLSQFKTNGCYASMKSMIRILLIFIICTIELFGGKEANNWVFGNGTGLTFNELPPRAIISSINTIEGCSAISDANGELLFYTDGVRVWDKNNNLMPLGQDLIGHSSATQSSLIIPMPMSNKDYYIFTLEALENENIRLHYSIVDMNLRNGFGDLSIKNIFLTDNLTEKLCGTRHSNGIDYWVVVHKWDSDEFYSYLLSNSGLTIVPTISRVGSKHSGSNLNKLGYMKISPNGEKLALSVFDSNYIELFDFDKSSGRVSNPIKIRLFNFNGVYGIEFSPDSKKMYISTSLAPSNIYQIDISLFDENFIINSLKKVNTDIQFLFGTLQLATDNKIYVANKLRSYLSAIENPDSSNCKFVLDAVNLNGQTCQMGLPAFVSNIFQRVSITANSPLCLGDTLYLMCNNCDNYSVEWSGPANFLSNQKNPIITNFNKEKEGIYYLKLTDYQGNETILSINIELFKNNVVILDSSSLDLGKVCLGMIKSNNLEFINYSRDAIRIEKILVKGNNNELFISNYENILLKAFDTLKMNMNYEPKQVGQLVDTLVFIIDKPCKEVVEFVISAYGLDSKSQVAIPGDLYFKIGVKDTCIPVYAYINCFEAIMIDIDYTATIALNPYVFYVTRVEKADIIENFILDGTQYLKIRGKAEKLDENSRILAQLCGDALLGETDTTGIYLLDFQWENELIENSTNDGFLRVGEVCQTKLTRIKKINNTALFVKNNLVSDIIELFLRTNGSTQNKITVYDIKGSIIFSEIFHIDDANSEFAYYSFSTKNLSNGLYYIILQSNAQIIVHKLYIIK